MKTRFIPAFLGLLLCLIGTVCQAATSANKLTILTYHEIADKKDALEPAFAVTPANFVVQMNWLKNNGYHFVSVDDVLADRAGKTPLPNKAVLLTFDDGYRSIYTNAFPILKMFNAPAVVALIGSWLESTDGTVRFEGKPVPRSDMLLWDDIREMTRSGLVEMANHTFAMHEGILANPQGNLEPAVTTRRYLPEQKRYEDETSYRKRLLDDIKRNSELLHKRTGRAPRIMIWPYGRYNSTSIGVARQLGMPISMTLDDGANRWDTPLNSLRRVLVEGPMSLNEFRQELALRDADASDDDRSTKAMHVDIDDIYDPDPVQQNRNLGLLLDRIVAMGVNTVYLKAFSESDENGVANAAYFPNRHLPMRADLFNRVAWQIRTRTQVKRLYAWMPLFAFKLPKEEAAAGDVVITLPNKANQEDMSSPRLSPFSPRARQAIREIYQDLARYSTFEGLLFQDDAALSDYEDVSPWALRTYKKWGLPASLADIHKDDNLLGRWTILKINQLDNFAMELAGVVRREQPDLKTARALSASVAMNSHSEVRYSQSLDYSLAHYDFTAIMAMSTMENAASPIAFLRDMVEKVKKHPGAMNKVVFELKADGNPLIPQQELADTIKTLYSLGVHHVGYYPDNLHRDHSDPAVFKMVLDSKPNVPSIH